MKKRILLWLLALSVLTVPALAEADSMENFARSKTYEGQFSDLTEEHVFYENVSALYEYGLSVGRADGTYGLADSMTVGQAVIFAGRIRSLYRTGDPEAGPAAYVETAGELTDPLQRVYAPYLWYLQAEGVLDDALDDCLAQTATRAQTAHVLAGLLPEEAMPLINDSLVTQAYAALRCITDVTEYTPYYEDILKLYRCGISVGSDETGSFLPDAAITRGAVAAMLTRIVDPSLRLRPVWYLPELYSVEGVSLSDLVTPGKSVTDPQTAADFDEAIRYMLSQDRNTLTFHTGGFTASGAQRTMNDALIAVKRYCEQGYNAVACSYSRAGTMELTFSSVAEGETEAYRQASLDAAISVHDALWEQGILTPDLSQTEVAWIYYLWIAANCTYDEAADDHAASHLPYGLFYNGTAVCDGYTGAYNLLLKLEGIDCYALSNTTHIWTVATLDGETVHIDTTWGDQGEGAYARFFAMTPEASYAAHPWPESSEMPEST